MTTSTIAAGLIEPPWQMQANITAAWAFIGLHVVLTTCCVVWVGVEAMWRRNLVPVAILVGIWAASPVEPIVDVLGAIWYPSDLPLKGELLGWTWPPMAWIAYPLMTPMFYLFYRLTSTGASLKKLGCFFAVFTVVLPLPLDSVFVFFDLMVYYGDNPTKILGVPLYAIVVNGSVFIVGGAAITVAMRYLRGGQVWWIAPGVACGFVGYYVATQWPVYVALQSGFSDGLVWLAALVTIVFALSASWCAVHLPAVRRARDDTQLDSSVPTSVSMV